MAIVGQETLIKEVNKILMIFNKSKAQIRPHFILTGESGSGKSLTIQSLCATMDIPFFEINAAQLTKEGTSGNSLSKALTPLTGLGNKQVVCFVDEFDKLFISGNSNDSCAHESTTGVQNEFLKVLESDVTSVFGDYGKYINVSSKNVLFIFAGAFNNEKGITIDRLREIGLKTEFLGRVGLVYSTNPLSLENLFSILENSPLLDMYISLHSGVDRESVVLTLKGFIQKNYEMNTLGARMVNTLIHQYFIKGKDFGKDDEKSVTFQEKLQL